MLKTENKIAHKRDEEKILQKNAIQLMQFQKTLLSKSCFIIVL